MDSGLVVLLCSCICHSDPVTQRLVSALEDLSTRWATEAERGVLRTLNGGCKVPITIRTTLYGDTRACNSVRRRRGSNRCLRCISVRSLTRPVSLCFLVSLQR